MRKLAKAVSAGALAIALGGAAPPPDPIAVAFGARPNIEDVSLSPKGDRFAYIQPAGGQAARLFTIGLGPNDQPVPIAAASGKPDRLQDCRWVADTRLACTIYGVVDSGVDLLPFTRLMAIDVDGKNIKQLSTRENEYSRGLQLGGGDVIDWLPGEDGVVLMARTHLPDDHTGSNIGSKAEGLGVDRIDTRTLAARPIERANIAADEYISDGQGTVRIMGLSQMSNIGMHTPVINYMYRRKGDRDWQKLGPLNIVTHEGFNPLAIDPAQDLAYGLMPADGRMALYTRKLDGTLKTDLLFAHPEVDVRGVVRIGRRERAVGASYITDRREIMYFDPAIAKLAASLSRALPNTPAIKVIDASVDESKLLIFAGSDRDPGTYYLLDRATKNMRPLMDSRPALLNRTLATQKPIRYPAADGTMVPGYLTLPPGKESARGLPAIVLPHGGPSARDEWGFDWLSQYFAAKGYAVLQPNFRGSAGYGDAWFQKNGFQSWRVAVGDVADAGRWLVAQGIADPARLAILGWSYGGYAALQSGVLAPGLFKAVVAIAPVTDLVQLREEHRGWTDYDLVTKFIGTGPHLREGSPAQNAAKIGVPVLLFHGTLDRNVRYAESTLMAARLRAAKRDVELVTFTGLDHYLEDGAARAEMLQRSDAFFQTAFAGARK